MNWLHLAEFIGWQFVSFIVGFTVFMLLGLRDLTLGNALGAMFVGMLVGAGLDVVGTAFIWGQG